MNRLTIKPDRLARLRKICLSLPGAVEVEAWGDPTWKVRRKIFAMQKGNVEGYRPSVWLKAPPGDQDALVEEKPEVYFVPPYVGRQGWVGIYMDGPSIDWASTSKLIGESYQLISRAKAASKRARPRRRLDP